MSDVFEQIEGGLFAGDEEDAALAVNHAPALVAALRKAEAALEAIVYMFEGGLIDTTHKDERINALERERDGYLNALEQVRRELGAAREALASVVYVRDGTIYMLGEVGEQDPEGGGREWRSGLLNEQAVKDIEFARMAHDEMMNDWSDAEAENERLRRELDELREALAYIASEESGWTFKRDPLEHARSVIEEMRAMAQDVLAALDSGSGGAATRKDAVATPSGEAGQDAPGAADSTEGSDG